MDLRTYLFYKRMTQKEFAEKVGCHPLYIGRIVRGAIKPGKKLCKLIAIYTNFEVTEKELRGDEEKK